MKAVKYNKGGRLKISKKAMNVPPPDGYHWMEESGRYYLIKGKYKPHPVAVKEAKFKMVDPG